MGWGRPASGSVAVGRVLVVEDEPSVRGLVAEALEAEGYEIRAAADGLEALGVLERWRPDLIVLDLMMPVMDGWSFRARQLALGEAAGIPVVVLSAAYEARRQGEALGAAAVVPKPFDLEALLGTVGRLVGDT